MLDFAHIINRITGFSGNKMKKLFAALGIVFAILFFLYASLSALVNQGLSIIGAVFVMLIIVLGSGGLFWAVRK